MQKGKGFSLVEVLIAMGILMIALFSIAMVAIMATRTMANTMEREKAIFLAGQRLETLEGSPFASIGSGTETRDAFTIIWTVIEGTISKDAMVTVSWKGINGPNSVSMSRQISVFAGNLKYR